MPTSEEWDFENVYTYYDNALQEFYIWGKAINNTTSSQRLITLWPVVYGADGKPLNSKGGVDAVGQRYKALREGISLAVGSSLPFSFRVELSGAIPSEDSYKMLVEAEPAESPRDDLDITEEDFDSSDWPKYFYVAGEFENPGPDLTSYVAMIVTLYDEEEHVIGVGWSYETSTTYLTAGRHNFEIKVEPWEIIADLRLQVYTYELQIFGY